MALSGGAVGDGHRAPARVGKAGDRAGRVRGRRGVPLSGKAESQVFLLRQVAVSEGFLSLVCFRKEASGYRFYYRMVTCFEI